MKLPIYQVDAFTDRLFAGNPAAVVLCDTELSTETMQSVALENNLSETAFVCRRQDGYAIRWFTPAVEVDLCGHATLAAAHVLFNHLGTSGAKVTFSSRSGPLHVRRDDPLLHMDFPADRISAIAPPDTLIRGLGANPEEVYKGRDDFLVVLTQESQIVALVPDMALIGQVPSRGVIVTAPGETVDFVSRFFAPQVGVPEDPVTGSAHTSLVPYWSRRLSKRSLMARQLSRRGGELTCQDSGERVAIGGQAVTYLIGEITI